MKPCISVVVPCYNEEEALPAFVQALQTQTGDLFTKEATLELILVNDGSSDKTLSVMKELASQYPWIIYLSFSRNFGKEAAMLAGLSYASGTYVTIMDADLQDPPSLLPEMLHLLESGVCDSVAARRVTRKGEPLLRSFFARRFYTVISRLSQVEVADGARDYRLMTRPVVDAVLSLAERNRFIKGIFGWVGFRTRWLEFENQDRIAGETKWSFWGLLHYAIDGIVNFSEIPLSLASWLGFFLTILSLIAVLFIVIRRLLFGDPVAGWASTVCIVTFIGGVQLFCLGIIGKYLAKTYVEVKQRPHYIIAETNRHLPNREG